MGGCAIGALEWAPDRTAAGQFSTECTRSLNSAASKIGVEQAVAVHANAAGRGSAG